MDTMLIQLTNQKAVGLLHQLEELHIIRVLKENVKTGKKLSEKYAGKIPAAIADDLQKQVTQSRTEWNNRSI